MTYVNAPHHDISQCPAHQIFLSREERKFIYSIDCCHGDLCVCMTRGAGVYIWIDHVYMCLPGLHVRHVWRGSDHEDEAAGISLLAQTGNVPDVQHSAHTQVNIYPPALGKL